MPGGLAAVVLLHIAASGCSFIFVHGPPANHQQSLSFDCTSSVVAPVLDLIWAGLNGTGAIQAASTDDYTWNQRYPSTSKSTVLAVGVGWALLSGASAIYGFKQTDSCRTAQTDLAIRIQRSAPPPPSFVPPPAAAPVEAGCSRDVDCKADRICVQRECVPPPAR
jgi:hypothetical protein